MDQLPIESRVAFAPREEKKKKQKQEECDTEEKTEVSSGRSSVDQGSKGGGGSSQQPLKRGQRVREECGDKVSCYWGPNLKQSHTTFNNTQCF